MKKFLTSCFWDYLTDFLVLYHEYNQDNLPFRYTSAELRTAIILRDEQSHRKVAMVYPASLHLKAPRTTHKKNRILVDGYLDFLLYEAKKYEPDIALGIALGAYAGLREGEVVNVSFGAVRTICRGFGIISGVEIDLTGDAPFFKGWAGRTDPGSIKSTGSSGYILTLCKNSLPFLMITQSPWPQEAVRQVKMIRCL